MLIFRILAAASLCLIGTSISATARDDRAPLAADARAKAVISRIPAPNRLPCEFYGPCGRCDCPPSGGKGAGNQ